MTIEQVIEIYKHIFSRDPSHNDRHNIDQMVKMDLPVPQIESLFLHQKQIEDSKNLQVKESEKPVMPVLAPPEPVPLPAPVKLAPAIEPKPVVIPVKEKAPASAPATPAPVVKREPIHAHMKPSSLWDDKTPTDLPKKVEKPAQNATLGSKKKGKNK